MPRREPLTPRLAQAPFRYSDGRAAGLGQARLRSDDLVAPFRGVREAARSSHGGDSDLEIAYRRALSYSPLLGEHRFFSHLTAARLWRVPLAARASATDLLHVSTMSPHPRPRACGIVGHEIADPHMSVVTRYGLPVTDAVSTWLGCATLLPLNELVVMADHLVLDPEPLDPHDPRPWVTIPTLRLAVEEFHGRGAATARRALGLARDGVESRPETLLRLLLMTSGLPEPEVNVSVYDDAGKFIGRADLIYPEWKTVVEYDGDQHRTSTQQYARDVTRVEDFHNAGWHRVGVRKDGLFVRPDRTIQRVIRALQSGGWRP